MSSYYSENHSYYPSEVTNTTTPTYNRQVFKQNSPTEIVILEPSAFTEISEAIQALRNQQMVVLNLMQMDFEEAQRCIDFLAGGILMFDGTVEKIDQKIFIFAPPSAEIISETHQTQSEDSSWASAEYPNQPYYRQTDTTTRQDYPIYQVS